MKNIKNSKLYLVFALLVTGYYVYTTFYGIAFWESSQVVRNTEYNNNRTRGVHTFYHK